MNTAITGTGTGMFSTMTLVAVQQPSRADLVIRAQGIDYAYGTGETRTQVLFENDLEISRGEIVIMTGPSGSGKSTLLTLIGALRRMQRGSLHVLDHDLTRPSERGQVELRKRIGFIFQQHNLFSSLSTIENVRMAHVRPGSVSEMNGRCEAILGKLGLGGRLNHLPAESPGRTETTGGDRPGHSSIIPRWCWRTSRPLPSTPSRARRFSNCCVNWRTVPSRPRCSSLPMTSAIDHADRIVNMVGGCIVTNSLTRIAVRICRALAATEVLSGLGEATLDRAGQPDDSRNSPAR